jgi:predicted RNA-binding Zn ribbon-like protein
MPLTGYCQARYDGPVSTHSFHRGSLALDFAGTVGRRASAREERLPDPAALGAWLHAAGLTAEDAAAGPAALAAATALREAIARAAGAVAGGGTPAPADVAAINRAAQWSALARPALDPATLTRRWEGRDPVRAALGRVASDAIELLATRRERLVRCELPGCGALLLSHSRGPRRRWCSMETCGNAAKVAAHRARARQRATPTAP